MKLLQKIRSWIFIKSEEEFFSQIASKGTAQPDLTIINALAHYCDKCDRGFKNRGARNNHIRIKHKNE